MIPLLLVAVATSGGLAILGEERGPRGIVYVFKPLTTVLILGLAASATGVPVRYQGLVVGGLAASLAGDVFLMLPRDRFVPGLGSFLVGHLAYVTAFAATPVGVAPWVVLGGLLAFGGVVLRALWSRLGALRGPVAVYVGVILAMAWMAAARWLRLPSAGAAAAAVGALLFVASDTLLAFDRFRGRFAGARALVLTTYYGAQVLIALSVRPGLGGN
jgi:uncharacterized membrane protein YhhN